MDGIPGVAGGGGGGAPGQRCRRSLLQAERGHGHLLAVQFSQKAGLVGLVRGV